MSSSQALRGLLQVRKSNRANRMLSGIVVYRRQQHRSVATGLSRSTISSSMIHPKTWTATSLASSSMLHRPFTATCFDETPLATKGKLLYQGLDVYSVPACEDGHPLAVYGIQSNDPISVQDKNDLKPILLLHGRTWSAVPVYHLHLQYPHPLDPTDESAASTENGEPEEKKEESRSLMESLWASGLQPYTMDFRGFGGTPYDATECVEPNRCVEDTETVLRWIAQRHSMIEWPALLGWSQGALIAQLVSQKAKPLLSKLILYGSIYDPMIRYPREPIYGSRQLNRTMIENTFDDAIEDFTLEGTIPPLPARMFAEAALISDPVKANWRHLYQFNNCDPARVRIPTLIVGGDQDPYAPMHTQQELFCNLGRGADRTWSILTDSDHAVHLLEGRHRMINIVTSFIHNDKQ